MWYPFCFVMVIVGAGLCCAGFVHALWAYLERRELRRLVERLTLKNNAERSALRGAEFKERPLVIVTVLDDGTTEPFVLR